MFQIHRSSSASRFISVAVLGLLSLALPARGQSVQEPTLPDLTTGRMTSVGLSVDAELAPRTNLPLPVPARGRSRLLPRPFPSLQAGKRPHRSGLAQNSALRPLPPLRLPSSDDRSVRFGRVLAGSTIGAALGGLLGGILIAAASDPDQRRPYADDEQSPESVALLFFAGGPPAGAVLYSNIPRDQTGAYVMAVLGELVLGGGAAALGAAMGGDSEDGPLIGALVLGGPGVVFGAAGGATLAAPDEPDGALRYREGRWTLRPPTIQPGVHLRPRPGLHGTVSLVTVEL